MLSRKVLTLAHKYPPVGQRVPVDAAGNLTFDLILCPRDAIINVTLNEGKQI
jgi:hypothetical protein